MKRISILGSTGSIGTQTLEVIDYLAEEISVTAITANNSVELLAQQAQKFEVDYAVIVNQTHQDKLESLLAETKTEVLSGLAGVLEVASLTNIDLVVNALVGSVGVKPTLEAIKAGNNIGLANKETLVTAGELVTSKAEEKGVSILPIDSEHNAIFQALEGNQIEDVERIILTASGGPFREAEAEKLAQVTVEEALDHPNWDMGGKITIDSATLMNKGLEVIEAKWLFDIEFANIDVVVHPQSIVHSLVEYHDHSTLAELGMPDMKVPIQHVLTYPKRTTNDLERLDLAQISKLTFEEPNTELFPCLEYAYQAGKIGGTMPAVLNAANEIAVGKFLSGQLKFTEIAEVISEVMEKHQVINEPELEDILNSDKWARQSAEKVGDQFC